MLASYREQDFEGALRHIDMCRRMDTEDRLGDYYMVMSLRVRDFMTQSPGDNWDGIYTASGK